MDDIKLRIYKLTSPVNLTYAGQESLGDIPTQLLAAGRIIPRTKEEGYALAAWLMVKGQSLPIEFIDGDRTPIDIEEGQYVFLTWKPEAKPEVWIEDYHRRLTLRARPPLQQTSNPPTSL